jgi:hypothetical protein
MTNETTPAKFNRRELFSKKPVVYYDPNKFHSIERGIGAMVWPLNHPSELVSNTKLVTTSEVVRHDVASGEFETVNTTYKPQQNVDQRIKLNTKAVWPFR